MALDYTLRGGEWFVYQRDVDIDLSDYTHLRIAVRGGSTEVPHNVELKLANTVPSDTGNTRRLCVVYLKQITSLPQWRVVYIDLREFICSGKTEGCGGQPMLDVSAITGVELAISRADTDSVAVSNTVWFDELAAVDLGTGKANRLVQHQAEQGLIDPDMRSAAAAAIRDRQEDSTGLVPVWFDEEPPRYDTYGLALSLLVFVDEHERTGEPAFKVSANRLAARMLALRIPEGRRNSGVWHTAYAREDSGGSYRVVREKKECIGEEVSSSGIDSCSSVGNTAWALIALSHLRDSGIYPNGAELDAAIELASSWIAAQAGRGKVECYPGLVTIGIENNISAYFGLLAAGRPAEARSLAEAIYEFGWDPVQRRMKVGADSSTGYGLAMDAAGSWGAQYLRSCGREQDALSSQGFAATVLRTVPLGTDSDGAQVEGFGDIAGPWTVTVEATAQGVAAGILGSAHAMRQILPLGRDGSFPGGVEAWEGGSSVSSWVTTMRGVPPTAWVYFAQNGDPLARLYPARGDACTLITDDGGTGAAGHAASGYPTGPALSQSFPNPANPGTTIEFELAEGGPVELVLFDLAGQRVAVMVEGVYAAGNHAVRWDGRNDHGRLLSSGVYLYQLRVGDEPGVSRKLMLLR